ncbi:MAG: hypothetical protein JRG81_09640 [Deltaproteobacteria bacterium]|nr:hypothetical protein [Deltaproteobacteria bacterium]MBW2180616.1 hypothetical protein [Deltaproteobacteria bacterium]
MRIDKDLLSRFEHGLDPQNIEESVISAEIIGYGEISSIFKIGGDDETACKRMPLFIDRSSAEKYEKQYHEYCGLLGKAGITLPEHETVIIDDVPDRPVTLYIVQEKLPENRLGHRLINQLGPEDFEKMIEKIVSDIAKIWAFNRTALPALELAIDGQLSNWVWVDEKKGLTMYYIDTSTPLYRKEGNEQLDPELLLQSAPSFLRWLIRWLFLDDVMNRYYDQRLVYIDLAANLFKEQRPDLIPATMDIINRHINDSKGPLTFKEVEKYYKEDKLIWTLFLAFRRIDRWLTTKIFRKRYEFILPGKIKR